MYSRATRHERSVTTCFHLVLLCLATLASALLTGCKVGPDYHAPNLDVKPTWPIDETSPPTTQPTLTPQQSLPDTWWTQFHDPQLNTLVDRALTNGYDLQIAANRVLESRAQLGIATGKQLPTLNAGATYDLYRKSGPLGAVQPGDYNWYAYGFDASWELDLFGGIRRSVESATATYHASVEASRGVRLSLIAEVVRNYVDLRTAQRRLAIATDNLTYQEHTLKITRERLAAGVVSDLDAFRAAALVESTRSTIPPLKADAKRATRALGVLLAQDPDALADELRSPATIPTPPPQLNVGLPADLLRRRPDLRQAERNLAAATARIGVATADLYPHLSLTGTLGAHNTETTDLFDWSHRAFGIGPAASWNLFDAGRTRSRIQGEQAAAAEALAVYKKTLLTALAETENEMTALNAERDREHALEESIANNQKSVATGSDLYLQGVTDFTTVLDAERQLAASEDALALSHQSLGVHTAALCKALGGGWNTADQDHSTH